VTDPLGIYLQDHLAGATLGLELLERSRRNNEGTRLAAPLTELAAEIGADRETLLAVMRDAGAAPSRLKITVAWALEKAQRLKPNGRLVGYTPLARVEELESLAVGIGGKLAMWRALDELSAAGRPVGEHDFPALAERAEAQLRKVEGLRIEAARAAFVHESRAPTKTEPQGP
jgi:hypothetical protein